MKIAALLLAATLARRFFRMEFDLRRPVEAPPAPGGAR
jgi:hypothetical protein